jgi:hypothetical protein
MKKKLAVNTSDKLSNGLEIHRYGLVFDVYKNDDRYINSIKYYANLTNIICEDDAEIATQINKNDFERICIANGINLLLSDKREVDEKTLSLIEFNSNNDVLVFIQGHILGKRPLDAFIKDSLLNF